MEWLKSIVRVGICFVSDAGCIFVSIFLIFAGFFVVMGWCGGWELGGWVVGGLGWLGGRGGYGLFVSSTMRRALDRLPLTATTYHFDDNDDDKLPGTPSTSAALNFRWLAF